MKVHVAIAFSFIFHVLVLGLFISLCAWQRSGAIQEPRPLFITLSSVSAGPAEKPAASPGNGVEQAPETGDAASAKEPEKAAPTPHKGSEEMKKGQEPERSHKKRLPKKPKAVKPLTEPESVELAQSESRVNPAEEVKRSESSSDTKASLDGSSVGEEDSSPASGSAGLLDAAAQENTGFSGRGPGGGGASGTGNGGQQFKEAVPAYRKNPLPEYPLAARRRGYEGTVILNVLVDREGRVKDLSVFQSSQHRALDGAALEAVKNWVFGPAMRGEQKIDMWVRVPVCFKLK